MIYRTLPRFRVGSIPIGRSIFPSSCFFQPSFFDEIFASTQFYVRGFAAKPGVRVIMIIEAKAPTRVDFAGSTLDIWPLYLFHPGAVTINAAISRYAYCKLETRPRGDRRVELVSRDTQRKESFASFAAMERAARYKLPLLAEIAKFFRPEGGFTLTTDSEAPAGAGIGGSSAMAVAICAALDRFTGAGKSKEDWIHISRDAEAIVINIPTGTQDHYPPAFGGAAAIELPPGGEHRVELRIDLNELERRILVCYTEKPRQHGINNWEVFKAHFRWQTRGAAWLGTYFRRGAIDAQSFGARGLERGGRADAGGMVFP